MRWDDVVEGIGRMRPEPGDIVLARVARNQPPASIHEVQRQVQAILPQGVTAVVTNGTVELSLIGRPESGDVVIVAMDEAARKEARDQVLRRLEEILPAGVRLEVVVGLPTAAKVIALRRGSGGG